MSAWELGEWDDHLGYDCMTGGVRAGPVVLDGGGYGQKSCQPISAEGLARIMADARLIAAAPELREALENLFIHVGMGWEVDDCLKAAEAVLAKVDGR